MTDELVFDLSRLGEQPEGLVRYHWVRDSYSSGLKWPRLLTVAVLKE